MKSPKKPSVTVTEEELMYWWSQFPDLDKEEVREIVELCEDQSQDYKMYNDANNEAS